jgi:diguanylate cyclase (GGDEF)-like protein
MSTKPESDASSLGIGRAAEHRRHTPAASSPHPGQGSLLSGERASPSAPRLARTRLVLLELRGAEPGAVFAISGNSTTIGRDRTADVVLSDATVSSEHARMTVASDGVCIQDLDSRNGTFVNDRRVRGSCRLVDGDYLNFGGAHTVVKFALMSELEERALQTLFELTLRDPLTRLYNRRYLDERLLAEFAFAQRSRSPLALLLIDIDHFKHFNDSFGHQVGDAVLKLVTSSIQKMMRPEDVLARYGGEEFVVIARGTSLRNVHILGERLCQQIRGLALELPERGLGVTVSIGASFTGPGASWGSVADMLRAADQALFEAKSTGRDRTCSATSPEK